MGRKGARPDRLGGLAVVRWTDTAATAVALGVTDRSLQRFVRKGLPSNGGGNRVAYPWPHTSIWYSEYVIEQHRTGSCTHLPFDEALRRDRESAANGA